MKRLAMYALAGAFALMLSSGPAKAAETTGSLDVTADVVAACTVATTTVAFTGYDGTADVAASGDVTVNCSSGTAYNIALDAGQNGDRMLSDGAGNLLGYGLYQDSALSALWGDMDHAATTFGTGVAGTGTGADQPHTVYGNLPTATGVVPGAYTDVVNVTVIY